MSFILLVPQPWDMYIPLSASALFLPVFPIFDQVRVIPREKGNDSHKDRFTISGKGIQTEGLSTHLLPPCIHPCPQDKWVDTLSRIHWEECRGSLDRVLTRTSLGTVVDFRYSWDLLVLLCVPVPREDVLILSVSKIN